VTLIASEAPREPKLTSRRADKDRRFRRARDLQVPIATVRELEGGSEAKSRLSRDAQSVPAPLNWSPQTPEPGHWEGRYFVFDWPTNPNGSRSR